MSNWPAAGEYVMYWCRMHPKFISPLARSYNPLQTHLQPKENGQWDLNNIKVQQYLKDNHKEDTATLYVTDDKAALYNVIKREFDMWVSVRPGAKPDDKEYEIEHDELNDIINKLEGKTEILVTLDQMQKLVDIVGIGDQLREEAISIEDITKSFYGNDEDENEGLLDAEVELESYTPDNIANLMEDLDDKGPYQLSIVCSWCKKHMGFKPTSEPKMHGETTHSMCRDCEAAEYRKMGMEPPHELDDKDTFSDECACQQKGWSAVDCAFNQCNCECHPAGPADERRPRPDLFGEDINKGLDDEDEFSGQENYVTAWIKWPEGKFAGPDEAVTAALQMMANWGYRIALEDTMTFKPTDKNNPTRWKYEKVGVYAYVSDDLIEELKDEGDLTYGNAYREPWVVLNIDVGDNERYFPTPDPDDYPRRTGFRGLGRYDESVAHGLDDEDEFGRGCAFCGGFEELHPYAVRGRRIMVCTLCRHQPWFYDLRQTRLQEDLDDKDEFGHVQVLQCYKENGPDSFKLVYAFEDGTELYWFGNARSTRHGLIWHDSVKVKSDGRSTEFMIHPEVDIPESAEPYMQGVHRFDGEQKPFPAQLFKKWNQEMGEIQQHAFKFCRSLPESFDESLNEALKPPTMAAIFNNRGVVPDPCEFGPKVSADSSDTGLDDTDTFRKTHGNPCGDHDVVLRDKEGNDITSKLNLAFCKSSNPRYDALGIWVGHSPNWKEHHEFEAFPGQLSTRPPLLGPECVVWVDAPIDNSYYKAAWYNPENGLWTDE